VRGVGAQKSVGELRLAVMKNGMGEQRRLEDKHVGERIEEGLQNGGK
jgi:hypothetical protein